MKVSPTTGSFGSSSEKINLSTHQIYGYQEGKFNAPFGAFCLKLGEKPMIAQS